MAEITKKPLYRLASSTLIEPLVNQWPAWSFLIAPVPASLHLLNYQIGAMESYLEDPKTHIQASRNPALVGGPFIDIPDSRVNEVKDLLRSTRNRQRKHIEFATALIDFHNWLVDEATGQSLEPLYSMTPEPLRGHIELVYDYYDRPSIRFFENTLYRSEYYSKELQSLRIRRLRRDSDRTFILSTPRLNNPDEINWSMPFEDSRVDDLFKLDTEPQPLERICEMLGISEKESENLLPMLSNTTSPVAEKWNGSAVRMKYMGHACVLVEWQGVSILIDPVIGAIPSEGGERRFSYHDLPEKITYVLITHNHHDHFSLETLLRLRHRTECIVVPKSFGMLFGDVSLKLMAKQLNFKQVIEMEPLESIELPNGEIIAVPFLGEHADLAHGKTGYVIRRGADQILFAADSDFLDREAYENVRRCLGRIQTVFLGAECVGAPLSWVCGPLFTRKIARDKEEDRRYHGCDSERAIGLLETVGAERIYNYAMGMEPWVEHLLGLGLAEDSIQIKESNRLLSQARSRGFSVVERLYGKCEIHLSETASLQPSLVAAGRVTKRPVEPLADENDQFVF